MYAGARDNAYQDLQAMLARKRAWKSRVRQIRALRRALKFGVPTFGGVDTSTMRRCVQEHNFLATRTSSNYSCVLEHNFLTTTNS